MRPEAATPWTIARASGETLYPWQRAVQRDVLADHSSVAVRAANESGKTSRIAVWLAIWHGLVYPQGKIVFTSGSWRQVEHQFVPRLHQAVRRFEGWEPMKFGFRTKKGGECVCFSTDDPGRFEGWHNDGDQAPLLVILDEAKSIPDTIFEVVDMRCKPMRLVVMSSTGGESGFFYNIFSRNGAHYKLFTITAADCPHITPESCSKLIAKWGVNHPVVRSSLYSEFMKSIGSVYAIPFEHLDRCLRHPPAWIDVGSPVAFCDFAGGRDENVLAVRRGNRIAPEDLVSWVEQDTMAAVGRFIIEFRKRNLEAGQIFCDVGGLGKPMADAMREAGWDVNRVNNQESAHESALFLNRGAEMWYEAGRQIERMECIIPDDPVLIQQLTSRKGGADHRGKQRLEEKELMRADGRGSPDRADAVCGAIANQAVVYRGAMDFDDGNWMSGETDQRKEHGGALAGAWAG